MVFYRKYRCQTIAELDNAKLRETLYTIFAKGTADSFPHAFLFTGPKGLGKTSTARIIAKVVNCEQPVLGKGTIEPCCMCNQCISIAEGTNLDVLEIDGASNRGIDEIRDLREKARLSPINAKKKIYIIDEVHMLTTEAFNALLKTIEEPPAHVMFVFCTTEPQKVPATIISRCFHSALSIATEEELIRSFKRVADGEKITIDNDTLRMIAQLADGGFRDGVKILEELSLIADAFVITKELVDKRFQILSIKAHVLRMLELFAEKKTKEAVGLVSTLVEQGIDIKYFISEMIHMLHELLLEKVGVSEKSVKLKTQNSKLEIEDIKDLISLLTSAYQEVKYSVLSQLPLEMAIVAWGLDEKQNQSLSDNKSYSVSGLKPTMSSLLKKQHSMRINTILGKGETKPQPKITAIVKQSEFSAQTDEKQSLLENLIYSVKSYNQSVAAVLRGCVIRNVDNISITFETAYKFHKERLEDKKSLDILLKAVKELTGKNLDISIVLKK